MKKTLLFLTCAIALIFAACGKSDKEEQNSYKFDNEKAGQIIQKYNGDFSNISPEDVEVIATQTVAYFDDWTQLENDLKSETDQAKSEETRNKFDEKHNNADQIVAICEQLATAGALSEEKAKAVKEAENKSRVSRGLEPKE